MRFLLCLFLFCSSFTIQAQNGVPDNINLIRQQVVLLQKRLEQTNAELQQLQAAHDTRLLELTVDKRNPKNNLEKAQLDLAITKTNLDNLLLERNDVQQRINALEKNIQDIENQLNVLNMFNLKMVTKEKSKVEFYYQNIQKQKQLLQAEQQRFKYLQRLWQVNNNIWQLKQDNIIRLNSFLKNRQLTLFEQKQAQDELTYQELQNHWLKIVNDLNSQLKNSQQVKSQGIEQAIFYANENASYAYIQSLLARYQEQIRQLSEATRKNTSLRVLNDIRDQVQILNKQVTSLSSLLKARSDILNRTLLFVRNHGKSEDTTFITQLVAFTTQYQSTNAAINQLMTSLTGLRQVLDQTLQSELSARQGFPPLNSKTLLDLGKEILFVPTLTFQLIKGLSNHLYDQWYALTTYGWVSFLAVQLILGIAFYAVRNFMMMVNFYAPTDLAEHFSLRWLLLQWLQRNFIDLVLIADLIGSLLFFDVPLQAFNAILYLSCVWLFFKGILTIARLCLVETTHDSAGHDVKLYYRLKWIVLSGGLITALSVFLHQLPLIYELKALCNQFFLLFLMLISLFLLRSWDVVHHLITTNMDIKHPYIRKSISLITILIPMLIFANALVGLFGYMNLILIVSRYEGIFLLVLFCYLVLRGLLSDGMEQLSRLLIQYVHNGWLWTEAILKPLDKVLRIALFLMAWAVLFLLYGWDKQSPMVERLTRLLHYELASMLGTVITPLNIIELVVVVSVFYWSAKWTREFVYRLLLPRTQDMGIRNSIAILMQYSVIVIGALLCLRVLGINLQALAIVFSVFALGIGWGLRDIANNFACGFLILLERPLRVGDIVSINDIEGEVLHIGSRAVIVRTWDHMELVVPNTEIFNKSFTNWTAKDNIVRTVVHIKISRYDNPHEVKILIQNVLANHKEILQDPVPEVYLKEITDILIDFEVRYYVNIRQVRSRTYVISSVLMQIWDVFALHGIKPPHPQQEIFISHERPKIELQVPVAENTINPHVKPS